MNECVKGWISEWMNQWINESMNQWVNELMPGLWWWIRALNPSPVCQDELKFWISTFLKNKQI